MERVCTLCDQGCIQPREFAEDHEATQTFPWPSTSATMATVDMQEGQNERKPFKSSETVAPGATEGKEDPVLVSTAAGTPNGLPALFIGARLKWMADPMTRHSG